MRRIEPNTNINYGKRAKVYLSHMLHNYLHHKLGTRLISKSKYLEQSNSIKSYFVEFLFSSGLTSIFAIGTVVLAFVTGLLTGLWSIAIDLTPFLARLLFSIEVAESSLPDDNFVIGLLLCIPLVVGTFLLHLLQVRNIQRFKELKCFSDRHFEPSKLYIVYTVFCGILAGLSFFLIPIILDLKLETIARLSAPFAAILLLISVTALLLASVTAFHFYCVIPSKKTLDKTLGILIPIACLIIGMVVINIPIIIETFLFILAAWVWAVITIINAFWYLAFGVSYSFELSPKDSNNKKADSKHPESTEKLKTVNSWIWQELGLYCLIFLIFATALFFMFLLSSCTYVYFIDIMQQR